MITLFAFFNAASVSNLLRKFEKTQKILQADMEEVVLGVIQEEKDPEA